MHSFLSKVFGRKKEDKAPSPTTLAPGELLDGKFEAVSPNVSPSANNFLELDTTANGHDAKDKGKEVGFSKIFRAKSRPSSPEVNHKKLDTLPHLSLNFRETREVARELGFLLEVDSETHDLLSDAIIGQRRLNPLEALVLIQACSKAITSRGLETLGIMHPHWYSSSAEVQRRLISHFIQSLASPNNQDPSSPVLTSPVSLFESELNFTRSPHDIAAVLRWGLRHLQIEGDSFGTDDGWYTRFLDAEAAAEYPPTAFTDKLAPNLPPAHLSLLTATLEIFSSLAAHAETNSTSGSKLCKMFGLWLLTARRVEDKDDWVTFYNRWERTGRMLEHIFLARIRDESTDQRMPVRLLELVRKYPYTQGISSPMTDQRLLPRPRFTTQSYDALFVRIEIEFPKKGLEPKGKMHPLNLLADAFSTKVTEGEFAELWGKITSASKNGSNPSPLSNIFADETIRFLSIVPDGPSVKAQDAKSPTFSLAPVSPTKKAFSESSPHEQPVASSSKHKQAASEPPPVTPVSPLAIGSDWVQFSSSGFLDSTPAIAPLVSTLFDTDLEKTVPPAPGGSLSRKSSKRIRSPRKSIDIPRVSIAEDGVRESEIPAQDIKPVVKASKLDIIQFDEAFIDFWSDSILDPITTSWPTFIICKFKSTLVPTLVYGPVAEGQARKTLKWLVLEQAYTVRVPTPLPSPPPHATFAATSGPTSPHVSRPVSPTPSTKKRFSFLRSISGSSMGSLKGKKKEKGHQVGEMGELLEEDNAPHVTDTVGQHDKSVEQGGEDGPETPTAATPVTEEFAKEASVEPQASPMLVEETVTVPVGEATPKAENIASDISGAVVDELPTAAKDLAVETAEPTAREFELKHIRNLAVGVETQEENVPSTEPVAQEEATHVPTTEFAAKVQAVEVELSPAPADTIIATSESAPILQSGAELIADEPVSTLSTEVVAAPISDDATVEPTATSAAVPDVLAVRETLHPAEPVVEAIDSIVTPQAEGVSSPAAEPTNLEQPVATLVSEPPVQALEIAEEAAVIPGNVSIANPDIVVEEQPQRAFDLNHIRNLAAEVAPQPESGPQLEPTVEDGAVSASVEVAAEAQTPEATAALEGDVVQEPTVGQEIAPETTPTPAEPVAEPPSVEITTLETEHGAIDKDEVTHASAGGEVHSVETTETVRAAAPVATSETAILEAAQESVVERVHTPELQESVPDDPAAVLGDAPARGNDGTEVASNAGDVGVADGAFAAQVTDESTIEVAEPVAQSVEVRDFKADELFEEQPFDVAADVKSSVDTTVPETPVVEAEEDLVAPSSLAILSDTLSKDHVEEPQAPLTEPASSRETDSAFESYDVEVHPVVYDNAAAGAHILPETTLLEEVAAPVIAEQATSEEQKSEPQVSTEEPIAESVVDNGNVVEVATPEATVVDEQRADEIESKIDDHYDEAVTSEEVLEEPITQKVSSVDDSTISQDPVNDEDLVAGAAIIDNQIAVLHGDDIAEASEQDSQALPPSAIEQVDTVEPSEQATVYHDLNIVDETIPAPLPALADHDDAEITNAQPEIAHEALSKKEEDDLQVSEEDTANPAVESVPEVTEEGSFVGKLIATTTALATLPVLAVVNALQGGSDEQTATAIDETGTGDIFAEKGELEDITPADQLVQTEDTVIADATTIREEGSTSAEQFSAESDTGVSKDLEGVISVEDTTEDVRHPPVDERDNTAPQVVADNALDNAAGPENHDSKKEVNSGGAPVEASVHTTADLDSSSTIDSRPLPSSDHLPTTADSGPEVPLVEDANSEVENRSQPAPVVDDAISASILQDNISEAVGETVLKSSPQGPEDEEAPVGDAVDHVRLSAPIVDEPKSSVVEDHVSEAPEAEAEAGGQDGVVDEHALYADEPSLLPEQTIEPVIGDGDIRADDAVSEQGIQEASVPDEESATGGVSSVVLNESAAEDVETHTDANRDDTAIEVVADTEAATREENAPIVEEITSLVPTQEEIAPVVTPVVEKVADAIEEASPPVKEASDIISTEGENRSAAIEEAELSEPAAVEDNIKEETAILPALVDANNQNSAHAPEPTHIAAEAGEVVEHPSAPSSTEEDAVVITATDPEIDAAQADEPTLEVVDADEAVQVPDIERVVTPTPVQTKEDNDQGEIAAVYEDEGNAPVLHTEVDSTVVPGAGPTVGAGEVDLTPEVAEIEEANTSSLVPAQEEPDRFTAASNAADIEDASSLAPAAPTDAFITSVAETDDNQAVSTPVLAEGNDSIVAASDSLVVEAAAPTSADESEQPEATPGEIVSELASPALLAEPTAALLAPDNIEESTEHIVLQPPVSDESQQVESINVDANAPESVQEQDIVPSPVVENAYVLDGEGDGVSELIVAQEGLISATEPFARDAHVEEPVINSEVAEETPILNEDHVAEEMDIVVPEVGVDSNDLDQEVSANESSLIDPAVESEQPQLVNTAEDDSVSPEQHRSIEDPEVEPSISSVEGTAILAEPIAVKQAVEAEVPQAAVKESNEETADKEVQVLDEPAVVEPTVEDTAAVTEEIVAPVFIADPSVEDVKIEEPETTLAAAEEENAEKATTFAEEPATTASVEEVVAAPAVEEGVPVTQESITLAASREETDDKETPTEPVVPEQASPVVVEEMPEPEVEEPEPTLSVVEPMVESQDSRREATAHITEEVTTEEPPYANDEKLEHPEPISAAAEELAVVPAEKGLEEIEDTEKVLTTPSVEPTMEVNVLESPAAITEVAAAPELEHGASFDDVKSEDDEAVQIVIEQVPDLTTPASAPIIEDSVQDVDDQAILTGPNVEADVGARELEVAPAATVDAAAPALVEESTAEDTNTEERETVVTEEEPTMAAVEESAELTINEPAVAAKQIDAVPESELSIDESKVEETSGGTEDASALAESSVGHMVEDAKQAETREVLSEPTIVEPFADLEETEATSAAANEGNVEDAQSMQIAPVVEERSVHIAEESKEEVEPALQAEEVELVPVAMEEAGAHEVVEPTVEDATVEESDAAAILGEEQPVVSASQEQEEGVEENRLTEQAVLDSVIDSEGTEAIPIVTEPHPPVDEVKVEEAGSAPNVDAPITIAAGEESEMEVENSDLLTEPIVTMPVVESEEAEVPLAIAEDAAVPEPELSVDGVEVEQGPTTEEPAIAVVQLDDKDLFTEPTVIEAEVAGEEPESDTTIIDTVTVPDVAEELTLPEANIGATEETAPVTPVIEGSSDEVEKKDVLTNIGMQQVVQDDGAEASANGVNAEAEENVVPEGSVPEGGVAQGEEAYESKVAGDKGREPDAPEVVPEAIATAATQSASALESSAGGDVMPEGEQAAESAMAGGKGAEPEAPGVVPVAEATADTQDASALEPDAEAEREVVPEGGAVVGEANESAVTDEKGDGLDAPEALAEVTQGGSNLPSSAEGDVLRDGEAGGDEGEKGEGQAELITDAAVAGSGSETETRDDITTSEQVIAGVLDHDDAAGRAESAIVEPSSVDDAADTQEALHVDATIPAPTTEADEAIQLPEDIQVNEDPSPQAAAESMDGGVGDVVFNAIDASTTAADTDALQTEDAVPGDVQAVAPIGADPLDTVASSATIPEVNESVEVPTEDVSQTVVAGATDTVLAGNQVDDHSSLHPDAGTVDGGIGDAGETEAPIAPESLDNAVESDAVSTTPTTVAPTQGGDATIHVAPLDDASQPAVPEDMNGGDDSVPQAVDGNAGDDRQDAVPTTVFTDASPEEHASQGADTLVSTLEADAPVITESHIAGADEDSTAAPVPADAVATFGAMTHGETESHSSVSETALADTQAEANTVLLPEDINAGSDATPASDSIGTAGHTDDSPAAAQAEAIDCPPAPVKPTPAEDVADATPADTNDGDDSTPVPAADAVSVHEAAGDDAAVAPVPAGTENLDANDESVSPSILANAGKTFEAAQDVSESTVSEVTGSVSHADDDSAPVNEDAGDGVGDADTATTAVLSPTPDADTEYISQASPAESEVDTSAAPVESTSTDTTPTGDATPENDSAPLLATDPASTDSLNADTDAPAPSDVSVAEELAPAVVHPGEDAGADAAAGADVTTEVMRVSEEHTAADEDVGDDAVAASNIAKGDLHADDASSTAPALADDSAPLSDIDTPVDDSASPVEPGGQIFDANSVATAADTETAEAAPLFEEGTAPVPVAETAGAEDAGQDSAVAGAPTFLNTADDDTPAPSDAPDEPVADTSPPAIEDRAIPTTVAVGDVAGDAGGSLTSDAPDADVEGIPAGTVAKATAVDASEETTGAVAQGGDDSALPASDAAITEDLNANVSAPLVTSDADADTKTQDLDGETKPDDTPTPAEASSDPNMPPSPPSEPEWAPSNSTIQLEIPDIMHRSVSETLASSVLSPWGDDSTQIASPLSPSTLVESTIHVAPLMSKLSTFEAGPKDIHNATEDAEVETRTQTAGDGGLSDSDRSS